MLYHHKHLLLADVAHSVIVCFLLPIQTGIFSREQPYKTQMAVCIAFF